MSNKKITRLKNQKKRLFKACIATILFEIIIFFSFFLVFLHYSPATADNTVMISGTPEAFEVLSLNHTTHTYFTLNSTECHFSSSPYTDLEKLEGSWYEELKKETKVTAVIKNKADAGLFSKGYAVVDLRSEETVYSDVDDYNKYVKQAKIFWCVILIVAWLIGTAFLVLKISLVRN